MKCNKCKRDNPPDSEFCQYCGSKLVKSVGKHSGEIDPDDFIIKSSETEAPKITSKVVRMLMVAIIIILASLNIFQYVNYRITISRLLAKKNEVLAQNENILKQKDDEIRQRDEQIKNDIAKIASLTNDVFAYRNKANTYDEIVNAFDPQESYGYASRNFQMSDGVIILDKGGSRKRITLTAAFDGVTVQMDQNGSAADIRWNESKWSGSTTTLDVVSGLFAGVTLATFSNDLNNQEFQIMIIVV